MYISQLLKLITILLITSTNVVRDITMQTLIKDLFQLSNQLSKITNIGSTIEFQTHRNLNKSPNVNGKKGNPSGAFRRTV